MTAPQPGARAPKFRLAGDDGTAASLADFAGKWLTLYFYPRDSTPGCTREARDFSELAGALRKRGAVVVGVSRDSVQSHCTFREKVGIGFALLSDPDLAAHRAYGAWGPKVLYGRKFEGTIRSTFLISPEGRVVRTWTGVKVNGHASKVLEAIDEVQGASTAAKPPSNNAQKPKTQKPKKKPKAQKPEKKSKTQKPEKKPAES
jgi:thioredoxin-dependent peroxiredoxin